MRLDYIRTTKKRNIKNKYDVINFIDIEQIFTKKLCQIAVLILCMQYIFMKKW